MTSRQLLFIILCYRSRGGRPGTGVFGSVGKSHGITGTRRLLHLRGQPPRTVQGTRGRTAGDIC